MGINYRLVNATIINEGSSWESDIWLSDGRIEKITPGGTNTGQKVYQVIDLKGKLLIPGVIDDQVHFREPGLVHKADLYSESRAAVAGGITSFMDMPNTKPPVLTQQLLEEKYRLASAKSLANYSFYMGASNDNIEEILKTNPAQVCGVKVFMGSSTGNMLVDDINSLREIFSRSPMLIAVHCEDEEIIQTNIRKFKENFGEDIPIASHSLIRNEAACYKSSSLAVEIAKEKDTRLHILHLSTGKELDLLDSETPLQYKKITAEVCVHHLWFTDADYQKLETMIKWNPAIKTRHDRSALREGLIENKIDIVATDHAPHTLEEKQNKYLQAPSGAPMVQHSLAAMLELCHQGIFSPEMVVEKMCHAPAICFGIKERGFIREGYYADLTVVDLDNPWRVAPQNILYKCKWSPMESQLFQSKTVLTFVNGHLVYNNGTFNETVKGHRLEFEKHH